MMLSPNGIGVKDASLEFSQFSKKLEFLTWQVDAGHWIFPLHPIIWTPDGPMCGCRGRGHCNGPGKHPAWKWGNPLDPFDPKTIGQVQRLHEQDPGRGWGLHCGLSGFAVLDIDPKNGGHENLKILCSDLGFQLPPPSVITGSGGSHYYFFPPAGTDSRRGWGPDGSGPKTSYRLADGVELFFGQHYVVLPHSPHKSGQEYAASPESQVNPIPAELIQLVAEKAADKYTERGAPAPQARVSVPGETFFREALMPPGSSFARARRWLDHRKGAVGGQGGWLHTNNTIESFVWFWWPVLRRDEIESLLLEWNPCCTPPWKREEVEAKIQWSYDHKEGKKTVLDWDNSWRERRNQCGSLSGKSQERLTILSPFTTQPETPSITATGSEGGQIIPQAPDTLSNRSNTSTLTMVDSGQSFSTTSHQEPLPIKSDSTDVAKPFRGHWQPSLPFPDLPRKAGCGKWIPLYNEERGHFYAPFCRCASYDCERCAYLNRLERIMTTEVRTEGIETFTVWTGSYSKWDAEREKLNRTAKSSDGGKANYVLARQGDECLVLGNYQPPGWTSMPRKEALEKFRDFAMKASPVGKSHAFTSSRAWALDKPESQGYKQVGPLESGIEGWRSAKAKMEEICGRVSEAYTISKHLEGSFGATASPEQVAEFVDWQTNGRGWTRRQGADDHLDDFFFTQDVFGPAEMLAVPISQYELQIGTLNTT